MNELTIYTVSEAISLDEIYSKYGEPGWHWYEPRPESLIDSHDVKPLQTLNKGRPEVSQGVLFSEMMLFYPEGSVVLMPDDKNYRYFYCGEKDIENTNSGFEGYKEETPVYLRSVDNLNGQYGISYSGDTLHPIGENRGETMLVHYYHENQCIAWTIKGEK